MSPYNPDRLSSDEQRCCNCYIALEKQGFPRLYDPSCQFYLGIVRNNNYNNANNPNNKNNNNNNNNNNGSGSKCPVLEKLIEGAAGHKAGRQTFFYQRMTEAIFGPPKKPSHEPPPISPASSSSQRKLKKNSALNSGL